MKINTIGIFIFCIFSVLGCQEKSVLIPYSKEHIKIDGSKKDPAWKQAFRLDQFYSPWEERPIPKTEFRSFHDSEFFYFHFQSIDKQIVCHEVPKNKTSVEYSDRIELFFSVDRQLSTYYGLEFDACQRMIAFKSEGYRNFDQGWSFPGRVKDWKVREINNGYEVEGRIKISDLREMNVLKNNEMLMGIFRADFRRNNKKDVSWLSWTQINSEKPDLHHIDGFQLVKLGDK